MFGYRESWDIQQREHAFTLWEWNINMFCLFLCTEKVGGRAVVYFGEETNALHVAIKKLHLEKKHKAKEVQFQS